MSNQPLTYQIEIGGQTYNGIEDLFLLDKTSINFGSEMLPTLNGVERTFVILNISNTGLVLELKSEDPFFLKDPETEDLVEELTVEFDGDTIGLLGTNEGLFFITNDGKGLSISIDEHNKYLMTNDEKSFITNDEKQLIATDEVNAGILITNDGIFLQDNEGNVIRVVQPEEISSLLSTNLGGLLSTNDEIILKAVQPEELIRLLSTNIGDLLSTNDESVLNVIQPEEIIRLLGTNEDDSISTNGGVVIRGIE